MAQRYSRVGFHTPYTTVSGEWVSYADYCTLDRKLIEVEAELQKYKDQFPDYVECANCGSVTHVEGVE